MERDSRRVPPGVALRSELGDLDRSPLGTGDDAGAGAARARSDLVDAALSRLFAPFAHPSGGPGAGRLALVALGGYGRRELCPGSDIDLMVLHRDRDRELAEEASAAVLYPLWDLRAGTGHAMRTPDDCREEATADPRTLTALLDARLLGGPRTLLTETMQAVIAPLRAQPMEFVKLLYRSREEREGRFGHMARSLEPDLKEALGGLRDVQLLGWLARGLFDRDEREEEADEPIIVRDASGVGRLQAEGLIREAEAVALEQALALMLSVRTALHRRSGSGSNVLAADEQAAVATALGRAGDDEWEPRDALLRDVLRAGRRVDVAVEAVLARTLATAQGGPLKAVALLPDRPFAEGAVESFAAAAEQNLALEPASLDHFDHGVAREESGPWSAQTLEAFVRILAAGERGWRALEAADAVGLIEHLIPEWGNVAGRAQRDPYHRFPVDAHLLCAAATAARLVLDPRDDVERAAVAAAGDPAALLLGAFLHDAGKTGRGSHVDVGVEVANAVLERMCADAALRDDVVFLVREHLLLSDSATRRNIDDEDLVVRVAARVGDERRLAMLSLLTAADAEATGSTASSPWRMGLVRDLMARTQRALEHGVVDAEQATRIERAEAAARAALASEDHAAAEAFLEAVPASYLLVVPAADAPAHLPLLVPRPEPGEVRTSEPRPRGTPGNHRLAVSAADRPGLLALVAGGFTLAGLSILSAQAFTTSGGVALDVFEVRGAFDENVEPERWRRFRSTLADAVAGHVDLGKRVRALRAHYRSPHPGVPVTVRFDDRASGFYTVVEVGAADRLGLLFDLATALAGQDLDVHLAKVATYGPRVVDVFYVTDLAGQKLDASEAAELEAALVAAASASA